MFAPRCPDHSALSHFLLILDIVCLGRVGSWVALRTANRCLAHQDCIVPVCNCVPYLALTSALAHIAKSVSMSQQRQRGIRATYNVQQCLAALHVANKGQKWLPKPDSPRQSKAACFCQHSSCCLWCCTVQQRACWRAESDLLWAMLMQQFPFVIALANERTCTGTTHCTQWLNHTAHSSTHK